MLQRLLCECSWHVASFRTSLGTVDAFQTSFGPVSEWFQIERVGPRSGNMTWRVKMKSFIEFDVTRGATRKSTDDVVRKCLSSPCLASSQSTSRAQTFLSYRWIGKQISHYYLLTVLAACLRKGAKPDRRLFDDARKEVRAPSEKSSGKKSLTFAVDHHDSVNATISKTFNSETPFSQSSTAQ